MKDAVDAIFKEMESKPSDFLNTFDKTITSVSKKFKVPPKKLWIILRQRYYQFRKRTMKLKLLGKPKRRTTKFA